MTKFLTRLNAKRVGPKWQPLTGRAVAVKLGSIPTEDLYYLFNQCKEAKSFDWCFFGALKARR